MLARDQLFKSALVFLADNEAVSFGRFSPKTAVQSLVGPDFRFRGDLSVFRYCVSCSFLCRSNWLLNVDELRLPCVRRARNRGNALVD